MLRLTELTLSRGSKNLLKGVNLTVFPGQKIGLIGANGTGKSSLFAMLRGELLPDAGACDLPPAWKIAWVKQETPAVEQSALDYLLAGDEEFLALEAAIACHGQVEDTSPEALERAINIAELHQRYQELDGYSARARAEQLLAGLGFSPTDGHRPVTSFSGGYRMRLNLAQALMIRADLLLLDEPTNHLDLETVMWLETWLLRYPGIVLVISHDRDFLDATVQRIVHLENQQLKLYQGNYSSFEVSRAQNLASQAAVSAQQERQSNHLQKFIERFRAQATKAKQVQSRIKALERMQSMMPNYATSPFSFSFFEPEKCSNPLLHLEEVDLGYEIPLLKKITRTIYATDRIGILGPNGAGKSTFMKALAGTFSVLRGKYQAATQLKIGYFAQHQLEQLCSELSPLNHLQRLSPDVREQELRDFLGGFNFRGDSATEAILHCSGGERARLALALLVWQRPHLLLLDEPTNHLDLEMREALAVALQSHEGALILVSHDRHLLRTTVDQFWLVAHQTVQEFPGDLSDYQTWLQTTYKKLGTQPSSAQGNTETVPSALVDRKQEKRLAAELRQRLANLKRPLLEKVTTLENSLNALNTELITINNWLSSPENYAVTTKNQLTATLKRQGELQAQIRFVEAQWYESQNELETLESAHSLSSK